MIDWPENLIQDLARRRAVVVLGSGVSRHSVGDKGARPPTWKQFLNDALADCPVATPAYIDAAIQSGDLLHACEWLKSRYDEAWHPYLRKKFSTPRFRPAVIHGHIVRLDSRIVFSLNFDNIYEMAANAAHSGSHIVKHYYDRDVAEYLRGDGRYIVKIHGSMNSPDRLIFTQKDYAEARVNNSSFYQAFDATLLTHSFLFIGSGYTDPDMNLILENQKFNFPASHPHYFLTENQNNDDLKKSLRQNRNLKTIEYDRIDDDHSGLVVELQALANSVEEYREELTQSLNW